MKHLLVVILKNNERAHRLFEKLTEVNIKGTVLPSTGLNHALMESNVNHPPIFGESRYLVEQEYESNATVLIVIDDAKLEIARSTIKEITQNLTDAFMFAVPLNHYEGSDV
ncbi:MAG TPA: hypothetical protein PK030_02970 [Bacilli bacterium]|nr:hypothetical protein [Bacilli bacterium]